MRRRHSYPSPNHTLTHIDHCTAYGWLCTSHVLSLMEILSTWPSNGRFNETFQIRSFKQPKCSPRVLWGCGSLTRQHRCFQKPDCTLIWAGSHLFIGACVEILARSFARDNETLGLTSSQINKLGELTIQGREVKLFSDPRAVHRSKRRRDSSLIAAFSWQLCDGKNTVKYPRVLSIAPCMHANFPAFDHRYSAPCMCWVRPVWLSLCHFQHTLRTCLHHVRSAE